MRNSRYFSTCVWVISARICSSSIEIKWLDGNVRETGRQEEEEEKKNKAYRLWSAHEGEEEGRKNLYTYVLSCEIKKNYVYRDERR